MLHILIRDCYIKYIHIDSLFVIKTGDMLPEATIMTFSSMVTTSVCFDAASINICVSNGFAKRELIRLAGMPSSLNAACTFQPS